MSRPRSCPSEDSIQQRQDDELLSITAIFPNEVKDLRESRAWKTWKPLELRITLLPVLSLSGTDEVTTQVELYVKCSDNYPNAAPYIDVQNAKGLSSQNVAELKANLREVALRNRGNEMLLELIDFTRNYLGEHKKPHYSSIYDEMMHNQLQQQKEIAEKQEKEQQALKLADEKVLQAIEQERNRKLEELKNAMRQSRTAVTAPVNAPQESRARSRSESICKDSCAGTVRTTLKFNGKKEISVFCGKCLNHNKRGCIVYHGMDTTSGDPVTVIKWSFEWSLPPKHKTQELDAVRSEQENYMKQLNTIEKEFKSLRQLKHQGIVSYLGMSYNQKKDKIVVLVLQEYVSGCPLSLMHKGVPLNIQQLQMYTCGLLQAIEYLHENSVVHRNIKSTNIFVCSDEQVKVSDYSLDKKLYDLYRSLTKEPEIDYYPPTIGKGGKKSDIYRFGVILLSLSTGILSTEGPPKIPHSLNPSLKDFLGKCLAHDEQERWTAEQLLSHPFVAYSSISNTLVFAKEQDPLNDKKDNKVTQVLSVPDDFSGSSRLLSEFEILQCLGKGGFGYVLKVRNKLDSRVYALKRIPLNPNNKQLDRKIKREVKVLSRLNHENIVRYYNSWIEEVLEDDSKKNDSSLFEDDDQSAANSSIQWEMQNAKDDAYSSDEEDCEDYDMSLFFRPDSGSSSSSIIFEDVSDVNSTVDDLNPNNNQSRKTPLKPKIQRSMFIQMEFCEKSTLRTAIDNNNLHQDVPLVWRLFREIIEGLHHIHQQGVIHRDLKPVNIFLDSKDHVKIGDFGLATDVISKSIVLDLASEAQSISQLNQSLSEVEDGLRTGNVGTALYVAPEIASGNAKLGYNQKVDLYSLGIIFFEMCYPPPVTAMERMKLIMNLRLADIELPSDIAQYLTDDMVDILKWLLQHEANKRPTSAELIMSKYLPPLLIEETELHNILFNTVSNSQSRSYKYMMNCLFSQGVSTEFDFTYDIDISQGMSVRSKPTQIFSNVVDSLNHILQLHGAVNYSVPTLMPKSAACDKDTCVYVVDHGGGIVNLPHDLRVPFARHIARHREITQLRRFTLEKVYREQKVFGFHPREQYEYAFDIITAMQTSFLPDAEVLSIVSEIIAQFPSLEDRSYCVNLNHVSLLKAILKHCGFTTTEEAIVCELFGSHKNRNATKLQLHHQLSYLEIDDRKVMKLMQFVDVSDSIQKVTAMLQPVIHGKGDVGMLCKNGIKELKSIVFAAEHFGVKLPMLICPMLVHDIKIYSGVTFQFVCNLKGHKKRDQLDILAAGGRYDKLISSFKVKGLSDGTKPITQTGVGASIAIEKIIIAELEVSDRKTVDFIIFSDADMVKEKCELLQEIWSFGFSATTIYDKHMTLEDVVDYCRNSAVPHLLILSKTDPGIVKIRSLEKEKVSEKKLCHTELKDYLSKMVSLSKALTFDYYQPPKSEFQRSFSLSSSVAVMNVRFLSQDKTHANRKREPNIRSHVMSSLQPSVSRSWEIIALDLKISIIGYIVSICEVNAVEESLRQSFSLVIESHPKHKKYLLQVLDEICDIRLKKTTSVILYSLPDTNFRVII